MPVDARAQRTLVRFMLLSVAAALTTMALKALAALVTGSVGFLSDALESGVNLVAALVGLWAVRLAARPPDRDHDFGHGKAEYLSAAVEGTMIVGAAAVIAWTAIDRLVHPTELDQPGIGLLLSTGASLVNLAVGLALLRAGRRHRSLTLVADGRHLLTDVVTSAGVLVGIALVALTGWDRLDPIVALVVAVNIVCAGYGLLRRSVSGILDAALPADEVAEIDRILDWYRRERSIEFHAVRTRESGRQRFIYLHVLVPGDWTVRQGHFVAEEVKADLAAVLPGAVTFAHVEPEDDPGSYGDDEVLEPFGTAPSEAPTDGPPAEG